MEACRGPAGVPEECGDENGQYDMIDSLGRGEGVMADADGQAEVESLDGLPVFGDGRLGAS